MSDSEAETVVPTKEVGKLKGKKPNSSATATSPSSASKRKAETTPNPRGRKKLRVADVFGLCDSDVEEVAGTSSLSAPKKLASSFVNRILTGNQRKVADTTGEFHIDLKVYNTKEAESMKPEERWKKAIVRIQFSTNDDTREWQCVQKLVHEANKLFSGCNPVFYSDSIHFK